jgi:hypothetical protein
VVRDYNRKHRNHAEVSLEEADVQPDSAILEEQVERRWEISRCEASRLRVPGSFTV